MDEELWRGAPGVSSASRMSLAAALISVAVPLAVHLMALPVTVPPGDSGTFITAAVCSGVAPPPGYPLYILAGKIFSLLPLGSPAWRIALMDALANSVTLLIVFFLVMKGTGRVIAASASTLFLGFSLYFVRSSATAGVMPIAVMLAALTFAVLLSCDSKGGSSAAGRRGLNIAALLAGLTCAAHPAGFLLLPLAVTVMAVRRNEFGAGAGNAAGQAGCFFLGLLPYLLIPLFALRKPYLDWGSPDTLHSFLYYLSCRDLYIPDLSASSARLPFSLFTVEAGFLTFFSLIKESMTVFVPALALTGILALYRKKRLYAFTLFWVIVISGPVLFIMTSLADAQAGRVTFSHLLPIPSLFIAIAAGFGLDAIFSAISEMEWANEKRRQAVQCGIALVLMVPFCLFQIPTALSPGSGAAGEYGRNILDNLQERAVIFTGGSTLSILSYLQEAEGLRRDVVIIGLPLYPWRARQIVTRHPELLDEAAPSKADSRQADAGIGRYRSAESFIAAIAEKNASRRPVCFDMDSAREKRSMEAHLIPEGLVFRYEAETGGEAKQASLKRSYESPRKFSFDLLMAAGKSKLPDVRSYIELYAGSYTMAGTVYAMNGLFEYAEAELLTALALRLDFEPALNVLEQVRKKAAQNDKPPVEMKR